MESPDRHLGPLLRRAAGAAALTALALPAPVLADDSAYVVNGFSLGTVSQYGVGAFGSLTPLSPATVAAGDSPYSIAIGPDGRDAYVTTLGGGASVMQYDIAPAGTLTPKAPASVENGRFPRGIAVAPDGASVYTAESLDSVGQYDVGPGGALTPKTPSHVATGAVPEAVAVSPDGRSVYVTNRPGSGLPFPAGTVSQFSVDAAGRLTPKAPPTVPAGNGPTGIAVAPDGRSVYVANSSSNAVSQYDVGPDGALQAKTAPTVPAESTPTGVAVSPDGRSAYVANGGNGTVSQFEVGSDGALVPLSPASVPTVGNGAPFDLAVSPDSRRVYVMTTGGTPVVSQYVVGEGGVLSPMTPASAPSTNAAFGIAIRPRAAPVASVSAGTRGLAAAFDGSASSSRDGSVARYDWDFGDGHVLHDGGRSAGHVYAAAGTYQATLTVTDDSGCSTEPVFTGRTASCGGGPAARATVPVTVSQPPQGSGPPGPAGRDRDRLAVALAARRYRATTERRLRVAFATTLAGRATLEARRGRRVVARSSRRVRAGAGTLSVRVRRSGRYTLRLTVRSADGQRSIASARLIVRRPRATAGS